MSKAAPPTGAERAHRHTTTHPSEEELGMAKGKLPPRTVNPPSGGTAPPAGRKPFTGKGTHGTGLGYHGHPHGATTPAVGGGFHGHPHDGANKGPVGGHTMHHTSSSGQIPKPMKNRGPK